MIKYLGIWSEPNFNVIANIPFLTRLWLVRGRPQRDAATNPENAKQQFSPVNNFTLSLQYSLTAWNSLGPLCLMWVAVLKRALVFVWSVLKVVGVQSLALDIDLAALHEHKSPTVSVFHSWFSRNKFLKKRRSWTKPFIEAFHLMKLK